MVTVRLESVGSKMNFNWSCQCLLIFGNDCGMCEIRTGRMVPESRLDQFKLSAIAGLQRVPGQSLEPNSLHKGFVWDEVRRFLQSQSSISVSGHSSGIAVSGRIGKENPEMDSLRALIEVFLDQENGKYRFSEKAVKTVIPAGRSFEK